MASLFEKEISQINLFEENLANEFINRLKKIPDVIIYRSDSAHYLPVVSFNLKNIPSEQLSSYLDKKGFCLRAGLHCSPIAHEMLKTQTGTVRFSPSVFNSAVEVKNLCYSIKNATYTIEKI